MSSQLSTCNKRAKTTSKTIPTEKELWGVYWLHELKLSYVEISKRVGIPSSTVQRAVERIKETGSPLHNWGPGPATKADERTLRHLDREIREDPFASYDELRLRLKDMGVDVSRKTVINYTRDLAFRSYSAAKKPRLDSKQRERRLRWTKKRVDWTLDQWSDIIWSDEARFTIGRNGYSRKVLRKTGERYEDRHCLSTVKWGGGSVMVWGCFWRGGFGPLVVCPEGTLNQEKYIEILSENLLSWMNEVADQEERDMILQEDGATCHTGALAKQWKKGHQIEGFEYWPAQSPDLNPIEHIWATLNRKVEQKRSSVHNAEDLKKILQAEWERLDVEYAERLVESMKNRCTEVIKSKGGPTRY